jgi:protein gp37
MLDWVIVGGESGRGARPMHPAWARLLRDQCEAAGVVYFFKQWGEWAPGNGRAGSDLLERERSRIESRFFDYNDGWNSSGPDASRQTMDRIGKKAAGRELDGQVHNSSPETIIHTK